VNVKEYISSGIIESYVLGLATDAERQEFEAMCAAHTEVQEARIQFELNLENALLQQAVPPPQQVKENIFATISQSSLPVVETEETSAPVRRMSFWKIAAAASVVLLAGASFWAYSLYTQNRELQQANNHLTQQVNESTSQLSEMQATVSALRKPGLKVAALQGTPAAPSSFATVYWDTASKDVYLMINNLPQPAADKQYQLWALIGNQPVDLGVFEMKQEKLLVKMKNVQNAQAFAITLEPKGGSPSPTLEAMQVVGKL
jgi:anti-sigma-K factor RskA